MCLDSWVLVFSAQPQSWKTIMHSLAQSAAQLWGWLCSKLCKTQAWARSTQQSVMSGFRKLVLPLLCWAFSDFPTVCWLLCAACWLWSCISPILPPGYFGFCHLLSLPSLHPLPLKDILTQVQTPWACKMAVAQGKECTRTRACCLMAIGGCSVLSRQESHGWEHPTDLQWVSNATAPRVREQLLGNGLCPGIGVSSLSPCSPQAPRTECTQARFPRRTLRSLPDRGRKASSTGRRTPSSVAQKLRTTLRRGQGQKSQVF